MLLKLKLIVNVVFVLTQKPIDLAILRMTIVRTGRDFTFIHRRDQIVDAFVVFHFVNQV